jgi:prevent-host-death family protein
LIITTSEIQNNFGKYLKLSAFEEVVITKNGKKVAKLVPYSENNTLGHWIVSEGSAAFKQSDIRVTYEEYLKITEESENRYEYIDGEIFLLASPLYAHQYAVGIIFSEFLAWFRDRKCEPLLSPFDVTLFKGEKKENICVVQPDIFIICDRERIDETGKYHGTPTLVVEVLSDSSRNKDLTKKLGLYMESGVKEYWIVNSSSKEIYIYTFSNLTIENMRAFKNDETAESVFFKGLAVDLKKVF